MNGCIAIILLAIFWYSMEIHNPLFIEAAFVIGVVIVYVVRKRVTDLIDDERSAKITGQATLRTFQVFWVGFSVLSIGAVMEILYIPEFSRERFLGRSLGVLTPRILGYYQLGLLCLMIFLYIGFRMYYARKYGDWESDEE
ncbi:DUF2178 domain-containing protein [uncultured Methanoregula sp.]|uniref:DUF2178 domain-containing protein n=1 Tax=uncultured Methanoregula sp. TaxID=1005933 RepID=UPI002AAB0494|nr:DUF2178 domain-containing protein [uncultured Methanoregula sp.]